MGRWNSSKSRHCISETYSLHDARDNEREEGLRRVNVALSHFLGKATCYLLRKHKRGKFFSRINTERGGERTYQCPRCLATWTRLVKRELPAA